MSANPVMTDVARERSSALPAAPAGPDGAAAVKRAGDPQLAEIATELGAALARRMHPDGSALARPGDSEPAVDATVWSALALRVSGGPAAPETLAAAQAIARLQSDDGRVSISPLHPGGYSPTSISVLAWHGVPELAPARKRAIDFLLTHSGDHFLRDPASPLGMDTTLAGWPWIDRTFSWAEPTALALLALAAAGESEHPRAQMGRAMLIDRQIAGGGWNYGNAEVFGTELRPAPESTGLVLCALAGHFPAAKLDASLAYLGKETTALRTPLALGWCSLAMAAWNPRRGEQEAGLALAIRETLAREARYGGYETADLALLSVAAQAPAGLLAALASTQQSGRSGRRP
ncbi:MAG: hypothetical protein ABI639_07010 [Thermoanaerobaculia bacterium]